VVYTAMGDRLIEDLRHEATHALLHAWVADLPLWLDEGLAEYFEVPEEAGGRNEEHLARLPGDRARAWQPDLVYLEQLKDVRKMTPRDYREAWGWVHYLLNGPPSGKAALLAYLADLRTRPDAPPLSERLRSTDGALGDNLIAHLERLQQQLVRAEADGAHMRLQDPPADAALAPGLPQPAPRKGFFARLREALGGQSQASGH
jgi:hypothetical protein